MAWKYTVGRNWRTAWVSPTGLSQKGKDVKIYVAGPYTRGDVAKNVKEAIETGDALAQLGHFVFIPHLSHFWHLLTPHEYDFWMKQDMAWLEICDAVFRFEGESKGADIEVDYAVRNKKPVYYKLDDVPFV